MSHEVTVLICRPTQKPNRIHFKSIRKFCIPKQKSTTKFCQVLSRKQWFMSLSQKSCTSLFPYSKNQAFAHGLGASCQHWSKTISFWISLHVSTAPISIGQTNRQANPPLQLTTNRWFYCHASLRRFVVPRHSAIAHQCSYLLSSCFTLLLTKCCKLNLVIRNMLLKPPAKRFHHPTGATTGRWVLVVGLGAFFLGGEGGLER